MRNLTLKMRGGSLAFALVVAGISAGCSDFMRVTNPSAVEPPALENPGYIDLMVNGVIGDFQPTFAWTALWSGVFTDELRNHHSYFENPEIDRRDVNNNNGTYVAAVYNGLHRTRFLADSVSTRIRTLLADSASRDLRLARVQAYAGYTWMLLGEQYCETPINRSDPVPSAQLLEGALQRFEAAIPVAVAAKAASANHSSATVRARLSAGADSVASLARVGAARVALHLAATNPAMRQKALEHARAVAPAYQSAAAPGFEFHAHYALDGGRYTRRTSNPHYEFITSGRWFSISDTPFEGLKDPRVPQRSERVRVADGTQRFIAHSPLGFSTYDGTLEGAPITQETNIRIASALEARYIVAELEGVNAANLAFINGRRAIGGQDPLPATTSAADFLEALRDQRRRDFFLDGHRMGDIRRYKKLYNVDFWPKGAYFGSSTIQYGTQECWPVPLSEQF